MSADRRPAEHQVRRTLSAGADLRVPTTSTRAQHGSLPAQQDRGRAFGRFESLVVLVERRVRVVTKGERLNRVWQPVVVEESKVQVQVTLPKLVGPELRRHLRDGGARSTRRFAGRPPHP